MLVVKSAFTIQSQSQKCRLTECFYLFYVPNLFIFNICVHQQKIQWRHLNLRPLKCELSALTTRPWLPGKEVHLFYPICIFLSGNRCNERSFVMGRGRSQLGFPRCTVSQICTNNLPCLLKKRVLFRSTGHESQQ